MVNLDSEIMKAKNKIVQVLGFDPNWICVIYDLIHFNYGEPFQLQVFPNLKSAYDAFDDVKKIDFTIEQMENINTDHPVFFGIVHPKNKARVYEEFKPYLKKENYSNLIINSTIVNQSCSLNNGFFADHNCTISAQTAIGFGVSIKRGSIIGHHCSIGEFTDINPGVIMAGKSKIGKGCIIGAGAIINSSVIIGDNSFIGMGSVVTKDIPPNSIAYGNPCKVIRRNEIWSI